MHVASLPRRPLRLAATAVTLIALTPSGCAEPALAPLSTFAETLAQRDGTPAEATPPAAPRCLRQAPTQHLARSGVRRSSGPVALGRWAGRDVALIADADEDALFVVDAEQMHLLSTVELPESPAHLLITGDGRVAVTLRYANRVAMLEPNADPEQGLAPLCMRPVAREPIALAERTGELLITSGFGAELVRARSDSLDVTARIALPREPRGLLLSQDGGRAWVSHMVGGMLSAIDLSRNEAKRIKTHRASTSPEAPSRASQGFDLAAYVDGDGRARLLMPQINSAPPDPEQLQRFRYYGTTERTFTPWVASVDAASGEMLGIGSETASSWRHICMLPRAALVRGERLWIACLDKGSVIETDARFLDPMTAVYRQYRVAAGPTGLAMNNGGAMFVWSQYGHALTRLQVPPLDERPIAQVPEPQGVRLPLPRRVATPWTASRLQGRELFVARDDTRISRTGSSCESCHPDGRDDGLMWANGNATLFLAGRLSGTAPFGWHGKAESLDARVRATFARLLGSGFKAHDKPAVESLLDYLQSRRPPPPPLPQSEAQRDAITRGRQLFEDALSCTACHPGGSANGSKLRVDGVLFDTPSLAHVAQSAPYFHDNRYPSLEALLADPKEPMDQTASLTDAQRADLASYLRSLPHGPVTEPPAIEEAWHVHPGGKPKDGWSAPAPRTRISRPLDHPGRYLERLPEALDLDSIPAFALPYQEDEPIKETWLALGSSEGAFYSNNRHYTSASYKRGEDVSKHTIARFIARAGTAAKLEIQTCHPLGLPQWYWGDSATYGVECRQQGRLLSTAKIGRYGFAARTRMNQQDVLLVMGPDTYRRYHAGAVTDLGDEGRSWLDLHALTLAPGKHAQLVRLTRSEIKWDRAHFPLEPEKSIINVVWPKDAQKPQLLVATLSSRNVFGRRR